MIYDFRITGRDHNNPVTAGIVAVPEHYQYSSAANYAGEKGIMDVDNGY